MSALKPLIGPAVTALGTFLGSPILGSLAGGLVAGASKGMKPSAIVAKPPTVMPDADDEAVKGARRRQIAEIQARSGRASTILSQSDALGG